MFVTAMLCSLARWYSRQLSRVLNPSKADLAGALAAQHLLHRAEECRGFQRGQVRYVQAA